MYQENEYQALDAFRRRVCLRSQEIDPNDTVNWYDLGIGFFMGMGFDSDKAHDLSRDARYAYNYWTPGWQDRARSYGAVIHPLFLE